MMGAFLFWGGCKRWGIPLRGLGLASPVFWGLGEAECPIFGWGFFGWVELGR